MKEARHLARCRTCQDVGPVLAEHLRALPAPGMTAAERARLWHAIHDEIEAGRAWDLSAIIRWLRGLGRRRPMLAWAPAIAAAILVVLAPLHMSRERVLSQAELNAQTAIDRVEAGPSTSVFVLETPAERLSIIWVIEPSRPQRSF